MTDTNMKKLIFSIILAILTLHASATTSEPTNYERRIERRQQVWQKLLPDIFVLQYAGGGATISAGVGWDYGSSDQWETHMMFGFIPSRYKHTHYWTFNLREIYSPWRVRVGATIRLKPLTVSLGVNSILHGDFWMSEPDRYPHGYYGFSSRMRFHLALGQRWTVNIPRDKRLISSELSIYYEVSTCDLYVRQKIRSSSIPLKDILSLGLGVIFKL